QGDFRVRYAEHAALAFGADPAPTLDALRANEALLESIAARPDAKAASEARATQNAAAEARRVLSRLRAFRVDLEFLRAARDADWIHWFEDVVNPHKAALRAMPRDTGNFGATLAELFGSRVFVSPVLLSGYT